MKLIKVDSKEEVRLGDSLYYYGVAAEKYAFVGFTDDGFIKAARAGKTTVFNPSIFNCIITDFPVKEYEVY